MSITATGTAEVATEENLGGQGHAQGSLSKLMVGAVGIVFGDIGTSPIYAFRETFAGHHTLVARRAAYLWRAQPDLLVDADHRRAEICHDHHARRQ